jgi:hypothetical protein
MKAIPHTADYTVLMHCLHLMAVFFAVSLGVTAGATHVTSAVVAVTEMFRLVTATSFKDHPISSQHASLTESNPSYVFIIRFSSCLGALHCLQAPYCLAQARNIVGKRVLQHPAKVCGSMLVVFLRSVGSECSAPSDRECWCQSVCG